MANFMAQTNFLKAWFLQAILFSSSLVFLVSACMHVQVSAQTPTTKVGRLDIFFGDNFSTQKPTKTQYNYLVSDSGERINISVNPELTSEYGGLAKLNGQRVEVSFMQPSISLQDTEKNPIPVQSIKPAASKTNLAKLQDTYYPVGVQKFVTVLCRFADSTGVTPHQPDFYRGMLGSTAPGLDNYWKEVSYGKLGVDGTTVAGWYNLPGTRASYFSSPDTIDLVKLRNDCISVADNDVNFGNFQGITMAFNQNLDGPAWGSRTYMMLDGVEKYYASMWMPEYPGYQEQHVYAHEMGHGFGLPHSSGDYGLDYDSQWDVMSNGAKNVDPTYGKIAPHTIGDYKDYINLFGPNRVVYQYDLTVPKTFDLERMAQPVSTTNPQVIYLVSPNASSTQRVFTLESRMFAGYDVNLPGEAVIAHNINYGRDNWAQVLDVDQNGNPNDSGAMWTAGETYSNSVNDLAFKINSKSSSSFNVTVGTASPSVVISSPQSAAKFNSGQAINITTTTADIDGTVSKVEFYDGTVKIGEDTSAPFSFNWSNPTDGFHQIVAKAIDNSNLTKNSETIHVSVGTLGLTNKYYFTWNDTKNGNHAWNLVGNPSTSTPANVTIKIAGQTVGTQAIAPGQSWTPEFGNIQAGPVEVTSDQPVFTTQRVLYGNSFNEMAGIPSNQLSTKYYFTWNDSANGNNTWNLIANPSTNTQAAEVEVRVNGYPMANKTINPGESWNPIFPGIVSGPVEIESLNNVTIYASQRVLTKSGSFNEFPGIPANTLTNKYYFTWNDTKNGNSAWTLVSNPSTKDSASVTIKIAGQVKGSKQLYPGETWTPFVADTLGGPVEVSSDLPVLASQRVIYNGSFNEFSGIASNSLAKKYYFTWNDTKNGNSAWTLVGNPSTSTSANVTIKIAGQTVGTQNIPAGQSWTPSFVGIQAGPVEVTSDQPIFATQRVLYGSSFNEFPGILT
jgi:M6 family metalloprotease-like protein